MKPINPMPTVVYDGQLYKLRSRKTEMPNFENMTPLGIRVWLCQNTTPRGYSKATNPLAGLGNAISIR
jgi:hypothetical protein